MVLSWSWNAIYSCALVVPGGVGGLAPSHSALLASCAVSFLRARVRARTWADDAAGVEI